MIVRPVNENGDMMPISYLSEMLTGAKAVAQVVKQRLLFYFGEWWEDEELGFRIPQFLADGVRVENMQMLEKYISSYIAGTEGVGSVEDAQIEVEGRELVYSCVISVGEEVEEVEVTLDGILATEY